LSIVLEDSNEVKQLDYVNSNGLALWQAVKNHGLEGIVAKKINSRYVLGQRSAAWLKIKNYQEATINVFGYSKKDSGVMVGTGNRVQGHAIGMGPEERAALWEMLDQYGTEKGNNILLPPGIRGRVKFTNLTPKGAMRDCTWVEFEV
ncbi:MAG: ATP-dependent DNA ligase, partial [Desulfocucumaceae bacterium]